MFTIRIWLQRLIFVIAVSLATALQAAQLMDFQGRAADIADHSGDGKWLVVMIWASDCHICNQEAASYQSFHDRHKHDDARVLGISMDGSSGKQQAKEFVVRHNLDFPSLIGEPQQVAALYSELTGHPWYGTPTFLLYSPSGELSAQQVGAVPPRLIEQHIEKH